MSDAYDEAYAKAFKVHATTLVQCSFEFAQDMLQLGYASGWNSALLALGTPEALAQVVRCSHGAALGVELCEAPEHTQPTPEMMQ